ncbi:hypothetical protein [Paracidobacterium acidisoli]|uniref:hypothetical protein n=1 Tax=Paracidobacterium acidisoli TaxID=2303751 RepID=UPI00207ADA36|nr:hypothetical protein [Paracidobacterium acidisoli]
MTEAETERRGLRHETLFAAMLATLLSMAAFAYCYPRGMLLLYGDAVAHMHIARRVVDSLNPGFRQLGSVWLPLPHLLLIPFVAPMSWWQSGMAGAIPSMMFYVLSVAGLYRLARFWLPPAGGVVAALFFGLNPGLLYMQTTAMTEPLFLCEVIWSALLLTACLRALSSGRHRHAARMLMGLGLVLLAAIFTRYDGWVLTFLEWLIVLRGVWRARAWKSEAGGAFVLFTVAMAAAPLLWLIWNARQFGDPLDFMRGPYSAKAIDARTTKPGSPHYPGWHSMPVAALYFLKAAELGAVPLRWTNVLLWLTLGGSAAAVFGWRKKCLLPALLLWLPVPFYAYSVAWGSVPIFIPPWWPHSWYNTRYGMEMLPGFALFLGFLVVWVTRQMERRWPSLAPLALLAAVCLTIVDCSALMRARPLVLAEAVANSRTRIPFEQAYARALNQLPQEGRILAWTSDHVGAYQRAGIPLKRTINETDYYQWAPALRDPAKAAGFVIAEDGDAVAKAVAAHPDGLSLLNIVCSTGQPCVRIYRSNATAAGDSITQK